MRGGGGGDGGRAGSRAADVAALAAVVLAALLPGALSAGSPRALVGVPFEVVAVVLLMLALPWRGARVAVATVFAVVVVAATTVGALDLAFVATIDRPFRAADDWPQVQAAAGVVGDAAGPVGLVAAIIGIVAILGLLVWGLAAAALRVGRWAASAGAPGRRTAAVAASVWILSALLGSHAAPSVPLASADAARAIVDTTAQTAAGIQERAAFAREIQTDDFSPTPQLLSALSGKDVVVVFVESYGRSAIEGASSARGVGRVLDEGGAALAADGYLARSAWLRSPTFGGVSWLAHATLQSGLWVDSPQKHEQLMESDRFTLARAFADAGWRTVAVVPSNTRPWEAAGGFYGFSSVLDSRNLGYRGPFFSYARVPDQFTLQAFRDRELTAARTPVMAEIDLVSSHTPWTPLPSLVPWADLGDGSVFDRQAQEGESAVAVWQDPERVREQYGLSIEYSLGAVFSYLEHYDSPDLVVLMLGDHQPARIVSGEDADHDVPVTIIAKDPGVMARIDAWEWEGGVRPGADAPVWRMDEVRDRFLDAFSG